MKVILAVFTIMIAGCSSMDAPWDPHPNSGRQLFDQIPAWDNAAEKLCCQHLADQRQCRPPRNPRC